MPSGIDDRRYREALAFYRTALKMTAEISSASAPALPGELETQRRDDATDAFESRRLQFTGKKLSMRFLFSRTISSSRPQISAPYPMWLSQIATRAVQRTPVSNSSGIPQNRAPQVTSGFRSWRVNSSRSLQSSSSPRR